MGKTKTKIIDDSKQSLSLRDKIAEEPKKAQDKGQKKPKDTLAASILEELNKEFGEVEAKKVAESPVADRKGKDISEKKQEVKSDKSEKAKQAIRRSKKYQEVAEQVDKVKKYPLNEAIELAQKTSYTKFPATMEVHINTAVKGVRGLITLPYASGKKLKILAFGKGAQESGADVVGTDQVLEDIIKGKLPDIDVIVTTPEWMPKLARAAKVLGPKGMMPNPKNGTITDNLNKVIAELQGGKIEYKTENNGQVIHLPIGKVSQPVEEISANIKLLYQTIGKSRIQKITLSPTMGPGVKVDLTSI